jgi:zinc/manganese transport system substrate-binding protein
MPREYFADPANENYFQYPRRMRGRLACAAIAVGLLTSGCGEGGEQGDRASSDASLRVVATTTHLADIVRNVGGDRVEATPLLTANADPHDFEVRPGDMEALADADLILRSGGDLDEWLTEAIDGSGGDAPALNLLEHVRTIEGAEHGHEGEGRHADGEAAHAEGAEAADPHWWQDPRNGERAVVAIRDALVAADPEGRAAYDENADAYARRLRQLDAAIANCMRRVPDEQRKLVTTHDSFGYYADRYDVEVIGTVIPSMSTQGQPSAGETRELVETIKREKVRAVFTERAVNPKVERAIADEAGATFGTPLWADSLGPTRSDGSTYLKTLAANTRALAHGFTGGALTCRLPS